MIQVDQTVQDLGAIRTEIKIILPSIQSVSFVTYQNRELTDQELTELITTIANIASINNIAARGCTGGEKLFFLIFEKMISFFLSLYPFLFSLKKSVM